ncbi:hypothetical protein CBS101457_005509 [Exobasidium rhododendri]|nr:hypothetical protein CBS101457_005509 [Exobasidium rhododendri]
MENLVTQGLLGLVFVLSIALWSKSSPPSSSSKDADTKSSTGSKKKNKKKKNGAGSHSDAISANAVDSSDANGSEFAPLESVKEKIKLAAVENGGSSGANGGDLHVKSNGKAEKIKGANGASRKKMSLQHFNEKTNEERVQEWEREARGDAGEVDAGSDMIDKELEPEKVYKKVARIEREAEPRTFASPAREQGWENVGGKGRTPSSIATKEVVEAPSSNAWASSNSFAALPGSGADLPRPTGKTNKAAGTSASTVASSANSRNGSGGAGGVMDNSQTKKQRQNAAKAQAKKTEKEAMEADRLTKLAQHKKQVEAERMKDHYRKQSNTSSVPIASSGPKAKSLPRATINEKGSLVWD